MSALSAILQRGTRAAEPAATSVPVGSLYFVTDEGRTERSNGATWDTFSAPGGWELLQVQTAAASAQLDFTAFSSRYKAYKFLLVGLTPGTTGQDLYLRISTDGGATFLTATNYQWAHWSVLVPSASGAAVGNGVGQIQITDAGRMVTTAGTTTNGELMITNMLDATNFMTVFGTQMGFVGATSLSAVTVAGGYGVANTANAVRFLMSSGNIAAGSIYMFGLSKL